MVQLFKVLDTGETEEIKEETDIKDLLDSNEAYIIISEHRDKTIWLWKGAKSSVRRKFIGAQKSQDVRGQVGMMYSVIPIDEGEETDDLIKIIGGKPTGGIATEIKDDAEGAEIQLRQKAVFDAPSPAAGMNIGVSAQERAGIGPLYTGADSMAQIGQPSLDFKVVMQKLEEIAIPDGYEREMIIIGSQTYAVIEKVQSFLGKKQVEKVIERISSIPEGIFFAEGYVPRILSENGNVLSIEFLKKIEGGSSEKKPAEKKTSSQEDKKKILGDQLKEQLGN